MLRLGRSKQFFLVIHRRLELYDSVQMARWLLQEVGTRQYDCGMRQLASCRKSSEVIRGQSTLLHSAQMARPLRPVVASTGGPPLVNSSCGILHQGSNLSDKKHWAVKYHL